MVCNLKDEIYVISENTLEASVIKCQFFPTVGGNPSTCLVFVCVRIRLSCAAHCLGAGCGYFIFV